MVAENPEGAATTITKSPENKVPRQRQPIAEKVTYLSHQFRAAFQLRNQIENTDNKLAECGRYENNNFWYFNIRYFQSWFTAI